jgi:hypothetical protein
LRPGNERLLGLRTKPALSAARRSTLCTLVVHFVHNLLFVLST